jgi:hypothetical protein
MCGPLWVGICGVSERIIAPAARLQLFSLKSSVHFTTLEFISWCWFSRSVHNYVIKFCHKFILFKNCVKYEYKYQEEFCTLESGVHIAAQIFEDNIDL